MGIWRKSKSGKIIWDWIILPLIGGIVISLLTDFQAYMALDLKDILDTIVISTIFWSVLANGNDIIITVLDKRWTWLEKPVKRAVLTIITSLIYTLIASSIIIYLYIQLYFGYEFFEVVDTSSMLQLLMLPLAITVFIALFSHGREFMFAWRQAAINVERLKNENLKSRFDSLRNQVNPHFLFNSLNALTSLVYDDPKKAETFVLKLADVYRYILDHQHDDIVSLQEEMDFLKSFLFLNKIRFGDNLNVKYENLDNIDAEWAVPPVVLQMLLENCLKHNEVSKGNPLHVHISVEGDRLTVKNNINPLNRPKVDSKGVGLSNIISRYELLTKEQVRVNHSEKHYEISIPLLKLKS